VDCWGKENTQLYPPGEVFSAIELGQSHACGPIGGGSIACWGADGDGQSTPRVAEED
jgi:hypothetical protein